MHTQKESAQPEQGQGVTTPTSSVARRGFQGRVPAWSQTIGDRPPPGLFAPIVQMQPDDDPGTSADNPLPDDGAGATIDFVAAEVAGDGEVDDETVTVQTKCACGGDTGPGGECAACRERRLVAQRRAAPGAAALPRTASVREALRSSGSPLDTTTRATMESRFGHDFGDVRVHTDRSAAASARSLRALAYTSGRHIVFGDGEYAPNGLTGQRLLAHELAHVVQQSGGRNVVQSAGLSANGYEVEADAAAERVLAGGPVARLTPVASSVAQRAPDPVVTPAASTLRASLRYFVFEADKGMTFQPGDTDPQALGLAVRGLIGERYRPGLAEELYKALPARPLFTPQFIAKGGEKGARVACSHGFIVQLMEVLAAKGLPVKLPPDKAQYLRLGKAARHAFTTLTDRPKWYTEDLFLSVVTSQAGALREYATALEAAQPALEPGAVSSGTMAAQEKIEDALMPAARALEAIRADTQLINHEVYKHLWPPLNDKGQPDLSATSSAAAPEDRTPDLETARGVLRYIASQPDLAAMARRNKKEPEKAAAARHELLDRFQLILGWKPETTKKGDESLTDSPITPELPPWTARLTFTPAVEPPFFDVSTRGEYAAIMAVDYPNLWAAWPNHSFRFERIKVPKSEVKGASTRLEELPGEEASTLSMLKERLAKDKDYNEADVRRYLGNLRVNLGAFGLAADPFTLNAALRYAGTFVRTAFQGLADRPWVARFSFPEEGLYVVRATATWPRDPRAAAQRPPSVAYQPVFARSPDLLAEERLRQALDAKSAGEQRLTEIAAEKQKPGADMTKLAEEEEQLKAIMGGGEAVLTFQRAQLVKQKAAPGLSDKDREKIQERIDKIDEILDVRTKRGLGANAERLFTVFAADSGDVLHLLIEAKRISDQGATPETWMIADSTTSKGKLGSGTGPDRAAAIKRGLKDVLEQGGYGRGTASVKVDNEVFTLRIEAAGKALLMEALGNASLVLSVVAVAAAPFTGGESIALLIPAGVIGAIPSAVRIIERGIDGTFRMDLEMGLDIVNVVGAFIGLGAEAQLAKRSLVLGGALLVTGVGAAGTGMLLLGAQLMNQIKELEELPPELRSAALMEILGNAMLTAGIMIGGMLAARGRVRNAEGSPVGERPSFARWWEGLNDETREELDKPKNQAVKRVYLMMDPLLRDLLTTCASFCVRIDPMPTPEEQASILKLAERLGESDRRWFKGLLHESAGAGLGKLLADLHKLPDEELGATIRSKGDAASAVLVSFSESVKGFADPAKNTPEQQSLRDRAARVVNAGKLPIERIGRVLDNVRKTQGGDPVKMLEYLEALGDHKVDGWDKMLRDLEGYHSFHKGATWVLRYLTEAGLWDRLRAFEVEAEAQGRRWDCIIDGQRYQFKSWSTFWEASFKRQIIQDYTWSDGFRTFVVKWVFEPGLGTPEQIRTMMMKALNEAQAAGLAGYDAAVVMRIKAMLPSIVEVGLPRGKP